MPLRTDLAQVRVPAKCLQLRILVQELPSIILCLVCDLSLPGMNLPGPMLGVGLKRRNFIRIVMSSHRHLNETLFNVLFATTSFVPYIVLRHSRTSSRTEAMTSCIEAAAGTILPSDFFLTIREITSLTYSFSIIFI